MSSVLSLPVNYVGFVGLAVSEYAVLNFYQMLNVSKHRKIAGVQYPVLYASEADAAKDVKKMRFNCAQRAHANTLEAAPMILSLAIVFGLAHPKLSGLFSTLFMVGRVFYTIGYSTGDPKKRVNAGTALQYPGMFGLLFGTMYVSGKALYALYA